MGKGSPVDSGTGAYDYFGTIAGAVCLGPVQELVAVIIDGAQVWPRARAWRSGQLIGVGVLRKHSGRTFVSLAAHTASPANEPPDETYWAPYSLVASGDYDDVTIANYGRLRIYWGTQTQTNDYELSAAGNEFSEEHPDYKGICYVILKQFLFGRERTGAPNLEVVVGRRPDQSIVTGDPAELNDGQANVAAIAAEILTSANGASLEASGLDASTFQEAADYLETHAEVAAISPLLSRQGTLESFLEDLALATDCFFYYDPDSAQLKAGVYHHGDTDFSVTSLSIDDLVDRPSFTGEGWPEQKSRTVVTFSDRTRAFKTSSARADDTRIYRILGQHRELTIARPHITRLAQAMAHGAETLRILGRPQLSGSVMVRREKGRALTPGSYVRFDIELEPGGDQLLQVFKVARRTIPLTGPIELELDADEGLWPIPWSPGDPQVEEDEPTVLPVTFARLFEPTGQLDATGVCLLAERPDALTTAYTLWFDTDAGGDFSRLGASAGFATRVTLRSDVGAGDAVIEVNVPDQPDDDRLSEQPGDVAAADDTLLLLLFKVSAGAIVEQSSGFAYMEIASISASALVSSTDFDLSVLRGRRGTDDLAHLAADTEAWILPRSALVGFDHLQFAALRSSAAPGYFRITPRSWQSELELSDASNITFYFPSAQPTAPNLDLSAPAAEPVSVTSPYPTSVNVAGTWSDEDSDLVQYQVLLRQSTDADTIVREQTFSARAEIAFDENIAIPGPGTWYVTLRATDARGFRTDHEIQVDAGGAGAKVAAPVVWWNGQRLFSSGNYGVGGPLVPKCDTPGSSIQFRWARYNLVASAWESYSAWTDYDPDTVAGTPWAQGSAGSVVANKIQFRASKAGYTTSDTTTVQIDPVSGLGI